MIFVGIFIGSGLLLIGLGLGLWLGRRMSGPTELSDSWEREQFLRFVRNFSSLTTSFAGEFSRYQDKLGLISEQAQEGKGKLPGEVQNVLDQILSVNHELQSRLEKAEVQLQSQTRELADYLTEARTDGLTGLNNRRAFDQTLDERFRAFTAHQRSFTIALIDIDFFKKINDTYGHLAGDAVLKELAIHLKDLTSEQTQVARYGGEEFAILTSNDLGTATKELDQFRQKVETIEIQADGHCIRISLSIGLAMVMKDERIGKLVRRSDEALYAAKQAGRNRVYFHDGQVPRPFGTGGKPAKPAEPTEVATPHESVEQQEVHELKSRADAIIEAELARKHSTPHQTS